MKENKKTGIPEITGKTAEVLALPRITKSEGERALFALSDSEPITDTPCPDMTIRPWLEDFLKPTPPTAAELAKRAARPAKRLEECQKLWCRKTRRIDEEGNPCTWEELRPKLDMDYQPGVDEAMEGVNNVRGPRVILYGNHECPDGVLANLLRAWYHLPAEEDALLFVNDRAKYAYFIPNCNPYMEGGELLGWDSCSWEEELRHRNTCRPTSTSEDSI